MKHNLLMKWLSIFVLLYYTYSNSVPLENWRFPFYLMAVEQHEVSGSPSKMFWDDVTEGNIFNQDLWPDSALYLTNYLTLEPTVIGKFSSEKFISHKHSNFHFDLLSDFKFGGLLARTALDVDQSYKNDSDYVWKVDRIAAGRFEEAYLQYTGSLGFVRFGRLKRNWGPFCDRSILLSNNPFSYDALEWQIAGSFFEFRHLFTAFPRKNSIIDTDSINTNRFLSAHALNFIINDWAAIGISEIVLFTSNSGFPDLQLVNPFAIYTVVNTNVEADANLMLGLQGWVQPGTPKITLKAQVIFDDFQVDNEVIGDREPMHWAGDFGLYWVEPFPLKVNHHFTLEYRYLSKWIYTVPPSLSYRGEKYTYLDRSLGYQQIDGDYVSGSLTFIGKNYWAGNCGFSMTRQDTNTIDHLWPSHILGYRREDPLSKRAFLRTKYDLFVGLHGYFKDYVNLQLKFNNRWMRDKKYSSKYSYDPQISLTLAVHYSNFLIQFNK